MFCLGLGEQLAEAGHRGYPSCRAAAAGRPSMALRERLYASGFKCYPRGQVFPPPWSHSLAGEVAGVALRPLAAPFRPARPAGRIVAEAVAAHGAGQVVERGRLGVEDHEPGAVAQRDLGEPGGGVDGERRADREEQVGAGRRGWERSRSSGTRFSPNEIVADLRIPPQSRHSGSSSPARTRSSVSSIGPRQPHDEALRLRARCRGSRRSLGRAAGGVVEPVDVLGDERVQRGAAARARRARGARRWARRTTSRSRARLRHACLRTVRVATRSS